MVQPIRATANKAILAVAVIVVDFIVLYVWFCFGCKITIFQATVQDAVSEKNIAHRDDMKQNSQK